MEMEVAVLGHQNPNWQKSQVAFEARSICRQRISTATPWRYLNGFLCLDPELHQGNGLLLMLYSLYQPYRARFENRCAQEKLRLE
jgi:hypothetical protein